MRTAVGIIVALMVALSLALSAEIRGYLASLGEQAIQKEDQDVSQITASKTCNGVTYTYTVTQGANESVAEFHARARQEIEAWLETLPC